MTGCTGGRPRWVDVPELPTGLACAYLGRRIREEARRLRLSLGRIRVVPVRVALADPTVAPVYEQLRSLRPRDIARRIDRRLLG